MLISKSHLLSFTLLCSSHHSVTSWTPEGGNYPCPRRTEQSTTGVHRPHMHPLTRAPIFIHLTGHYSGSLLSLVCDEHLLVCHPLCMSVGVLSKCCLHLRSSCVRVIDMDVLQQQHYMHLLSGSISMFFTPPGCACTCRLCQAIAYWASDRSR